LGRHEDSCGELDLFSRQRYVLLGIQIKVDDVISSSAEKFLARCTATGIRWSHILREESQNVDKRCFQPVYLILKLSRGQSAQILMGPSMAGNLMTRSICALNHSRPRHINHALAKIVSRDEKGAFGVVLVKEIEDVTCVTDRPVVILLG
jgi:hypothetical protein